MPRKGKAAFHEIGEFETKCKNGHEDINSRAPRNAANARERARMRVLSKAFCRLKTTLPWVPADTKLSKLDTLRLAATYIAHLRAVLRDENDSNYTAQSLSLTLSWPFATQSTSPALANNNCGVSSTSSLRLIANHHQNQHSLILYQNYEQPIHYTDIRSSCSDQILNY